MAKSDQRYSTKNNTNETLEENEDPSKLIKERRSQELIIGICGSIGAGTKELSNSLKDILGLKKNGYSVETIKITELILEINNDPSLLKLSGFERYNKYQIAGNKIREKFGENKLAAKAITRIIDKREKYLSKKLEENKEITIDELKTTKRVAYIIDQLKHPSEVNLLRTVYKQNFYLIGITNNEQSRKEYLTELSINDDEADTLMRRDKKDEVSHGQQVEKTFHLSDYFIKNRQGKGSDGHLDNAVERFTKLAHGFNGNPPTNDEVGMFAAYSSSLKSACLSRQVGAAIINNNGDILSTGCNDVPSYGGGLYTGDKDKDNRCVFKQGKKCHNDHHKSKLQDEFSKILDDEFRKISESVKAKSNNKVMIELLKKKEDLAEKLLKRTKAKDLIEYSRAIHAEMDALIQLARTENQTTIGTTMYTTTFPCHNCARHIVAAGIFKVVYIEPYEKSLAINLHNDSISISEEKNKVSFESFEGVSPRRYSKFFEYFDRKDKFTGKAKIISPANSHHIDPEYLDSYFEYENKIAKHSKAQENPN